MIKKLILLACRFAAYVIDYLLFYILMLFLGRFGVGGYIIGVIAFFAYRYCMSAAIGKTIGMHVMKLVLINYGWRSCFKREVSRFASVIYFAGYLFALVDRYGRTFHDIFSDTYVLFTTSLTNQRPSMDSQVLTEIRGWFDQLIKPIVILLIFISSIKWLTGLILHDVGSIGLKRYAVSKVYNQSFAGDNLLSLSQKELYQRTLGRRYTAVISIEGQDTLVRLANKHSYSEIYRMDIDRAQIIGKLLFKTNMPIQYLSSGNFREKKELCGVSPNMSVQLIDEKGRIFSKAKAVIGDAIMVKTGDIDRDGHSELVMLNRNNEFEIMKYNKGKLTSIFNGRIGDDKNIEAFYIDNGITTAAFENNKTMISKNIYSDMTFKNHEVKVINTTDIGQIDKFGDDLIISSINRNNMMFRVGKLQRLEVYKIKRKAEGTINFGSRPSRPYNFMVRNLEEITDIDHDGSVEIIMKAVNKDDVMGQNYTLEIYKLNNGMLKVNQFLQRVEKQISIGI